MHKVRIGRRPSRRRIWPQVIAVSLFSMVLVSGWLLWHSNLLIEKALVLAFPNSEVTYRGSWPTLTGAVISRDIVVSPPVTDVPENTEFDPALRFARVRLQVGFRDWVRSVLSIPPHEAFAGLNHLQLMFDDARSVSGLPYSDALAPFGTVSASPFEIAGCPHAEPWTRSDIVAMGLKPRSSQLVLEWRHSPGQLMTKHTLSSPGVSQVAVAREFKVPRGHVVMSSGATDQFEQSANHWVVHDQGFVGARNRFCAQRSNVAEPRVIADHLAEVKQTLSSFGLELTAEAVDVYGGFASNGSKLSLQLAYEPPMTADDFRLARGSWMQRVSGSISNDGQQAEIGLRQIVAREPPDDGRGETLEHSRQEGMQSGAPAASAVGVISDGGLTELRKVTPIRPPDRNAKAAGASIPYAELANHIGRTVRVHLSDKTARIMQIAEVRSDAVKVRYKLRSGTASYLLRRDRFLKAELIR